MIAEREPLFTTAVVCGAAALLSVGGGLALGWWRPGLALALGLVIGSANGFLIQHALGLTASFRLTSILRLLALSAAGIGLGLLLGIAYVPLLLVGMALAQLTLATVAGISAVRSA